MQQASFHTLTDTEQGVQEHFEPWLDSTQAARLLNIHPKTLQRMARKGEVPAIQIGKLWRFRGSQLNAWAQGIIAPAIRAVQT